MRLDDAGRDATKRRTAAQRLAAAGTARPRPTPSSRGGRWRLALPLCGRPLPPFRRPSVLTAGVVFTAGLLLSNAAPLRMSTCAFRISPADELRTAVNQKGKRNYLQVKYSRFPPKLQQVVAR